MGIALPTTTSYNKSKPVQHWASLVNGVRVRGKVVGWNALERELRKLIDELRQGDRNDFSDLDPKAGFNSPNTSVATHCIFTAHETYDRDNPFNRILKCALAIVRRLAVPQSLTSRAAASLRWFEQVADSHITAQTFDRLPFGRNTERYRRGIQLARLIILNYSPDLRGGREHVFAILFQMSDLFERFVFVQLRRATPHFAARRLTVDGQVRKRFWSSKTIRPDIVADFGEPGDRARVILDTKWKVPRDGQPADDDLKQMYPYNLHFGGHRGVLVYPSAGPHQVPAYQPFAHSASLPLGHTNSCATFYINLFDAQNRLRKDIGNELIQRTLLNA